MIGRGSSVLSIPRTENSCSQNEEDDENSYSSAQEGYRNECYNFTTKEAILHPNRYHALENSDQPVIAYHRYSLVRDHIMCRGRNINMLVLPLLLLLLWGVGWNLIFLYADEDDKLKETIGSWGHLIQPLWIPMAFLLVFRLARAAVRAWDSRYGSSVCCAIYSYLCSITFY